MRAELFTVEQLMRHARGLAHQHTSVTRHGPNQLLDRLDKNERILRAYNRATLAADQNRRITPASEWLLDNFYLIEEQIIMARRHLPRPYSRELPRLTSGPCAGFPRIYDLVLELISHVDAQLDAERLSAFVAAYQEVTPLKLGELWAIPIMLRLALIENLRRVTVRLSTAREDRDLADFWCDRLQNAVETEPSRLIVVVADLARTEMPMTSAFVTEFCQRLARMSPPVHFARNWLEQHLAEHGLSIEQLIHAENQNQAADQVSISHSITSLRFLSAMDWREFVESSSHVDRTLRTDPADVYGGMDFRTRDRYRHQVEKLARYSRRSEQEIASAAIHLAEQAARARSRSDRTAHVGHYLIEKGAPELEKSVAMRWPLREQVERVVCRHPLAFYVGNIVLITLAATAWVAFQVRGLALGEWKLVTLTIVALICTSQLAVSLVNWFATLLITPRLLPRLDFSEGIPPDCRTMVVVPTMLGDARSAGELIETLEIHYLANRDSNLFFALLTDFKDAPQERMPPDDVLVGIVRDGINQLNRKYHADRPCIFFLFHRPREWSQGENVWMGYERKRGKLFEFNALLRGNGRERFSEFVGDESLLPHIRFVITLDTDTQLPRDSARQLVGTIAHPLNSPKLDPEKCIVTEGYGILQPRVGVSLPTAARSWFVRLFAGDAGIDPYTHAVSDVYQDLFQEGSFIGKGIYDVDAFEQALRGRFPENKILSHDLIESVHARSALVNDVELFEEHPSGYNTEINRRHRWIRGDWQIAQWLLPRVPGADARRIANPLSGLSKWKILDNLRRSLVPGALLALLLANWILLPELMGAGLLVVLVIISLPSLVSAAGEALQKSHETPWRLHLRHTATSLGHQLGQIALTLVFLPYDAYMSLDAIVRTLVRVLITRRRLLEWQTSSDAERSARTDLGSFFNTMWIAPALALVMAAYFIAKQPGLFLDAAPLIVLWLFAPAIAWWISQPIERAEPKLGTTDLAFLHRIARKTWRYFETFVNAQENWLPPDNFQEHPAPVIAARTSPTNMGLALLANLSACDFGYITVESLIERTQNSLSTLQRLERFRGHFYNWYDTRTLKPLPPLYVSTVDSGNLAGHLLTLSAGLVECADQKILGPQIFSGLRATIGVLRELAGDNRHVQQIDHELADPPDGLWERFALLNDLAYEAGALGAAFPDGTAELKWWITAFEQQCREHLSDVKFIVPWLTATRVERSVLQKLKGSAEKNSSCDPADAESPCVALLHQSPTLREIAKYDEALCPYLEERLKENPQSEPLKGLLQACHEANRRARERISTLESLAFQVGEMGDMDFSFLYDPGRNLFAIGYNVTERHRDNSYYDLLASESRLASYVTIAQGKISQEHWFSLGRLLSASRGEPALVSWSGSMFEYLMPLLVMPNYESTLLGETCRAAVNAQIEYAQLRGVPWGISESGYNSTDIHMNYQYRAFGVPGLGFKRGLAEDLVIAPYASVMALMIEPKESCHNLRRLAREGREGRYGFYEAVDYTPSRMPPDETSVTVRSFMAHHQGMSLLSLESLLLDRPMQRRFLSNPMCKAAELLLQERVPKAIAAISADDLEFGESRPLGTRDGEAVMRVFTNPSGPSPDVHLLSNGRYHVLVTSAGGGYSRWNDLAVTRWREDPTRDCWGTFCYVRDTLSGEFWSTAHQPVLRPAKRYEAIFTQARAEFRQRHGALEMHTEISVSPEDDVELRRITVTNHANVAHVLEFTSYAEVVMAPPPADTAHPAFSNLFVQTEIVRQHPAILCTRRARSEGERPPWMFHLMTVQGTEQNAPSFETDRGKFTGRGRTLNSPAALLDGAALSNSAGSVLDPIVSVRRTVKITPDQTARIEIVTGVAESREAALALVAKYYSPPMTDRLFDLAWTHSQVTLRHLDATEADAQLYGRLASALVYANPARRAPVSVLRSNRRGQSGLWGHGISGDLPILLLRISDGEKLELVRRLVQAHAYWRMKGLAVELVILNEDASVYRQALYDQIVGLIASGIEAPVLDSPGGIFVRRAESIPPEDRILLQSIARIVFSDELGSFEQQVQQRLAAEPLMPELKPRRSPWKDADAPVVAREIIFPNGIGGFTPDGREYIMTIDSNSTPAPWSNVLANPNFGTVVTESGGGYSWFENSHEYRLTPWSNDPVCDPPGEALYIRDDDTGEFWSPTPLPARGAAPYVVRHGFGYTVFEHTEKGISSELWIYVAMDMPVKFIALKLRNVSDRPRRLSVMSYWEWVLGETRTKTAPHIQTEIDPRSGALLARNYLNIDFPQYVAFADINEPSRTVTGDRRDFLGRNGTLKNPAALRRVRLSGKTGAGFDPCGAFHVAFELAERQERDVTFTLGGGRNLLEAQQLIQRCRQADTARQALEGVWNYWNRTLGTIYVETPELAVNVMANGWLLYQTISARFWGRTGFYQSGGAYGFRDQLQDGMALVHAEPRLLREHILRAASRQFREGDVQHWWHPPTGRGVRTQFSDDYLWLPYAVCRYVSCVNDTGVLDERIPFLECRALRPDEESYYDLMQRSDETATLYEHCVRAIERGLRFGTHGLPLIGCGDWNDGFNRIGTEGRGESVWLAFFLVDVLTQFEGLARQRNDTVFAARCLEQAAELRRNIETHAWDGQWYRRAYFDNGEPLGSQQNVECQIDALPQSWAALTGAADPDRTRQAMEAVDARLIRSDAGLIQLFNPPFDKGALNPGYIKGYVPGVRENGGQYTHAAIWTVMAFAHLGEVERAWELFAMINPLNHGKSAQEIGTYKVEPYVVAADIYAMPPHTGRGGWTWYTGSAGWMYRLVTETLLGIHREGERLRLQPRLPKAWRDFKMHYRYHETFYHIHVINNGQSGSQPLQVVIDGHPSEDLTVPLINDHNEHHVELVMGNPEQTAEHAEDDLALSHADT